MTDTTNLGLPCIEGSQAQKHVTHNDALRILDTLVQLAVLDRDLAAPPASPLDGQRWIVKAGATGAWAGHDNAIAAWQDGGWQFSAPRIGWLAFVIEESIFLAWDGAAWNDWSSTVTSLQNLARIGVGTTADSTNPLSAKLNNALFAARSVAEGGSGDLRYKMSKEAAANALSLLLQTGFSARAELGLIGDDDFTLKVSSDGAAFLVAARAFAASGRVDLRAARRKAYGEVCPAIGSTAIHSFGVTLNGAIGTVTTAGIDAANFFRSLQRVSYVSATAAGSVAGQRTVGPGYLVRGAAAGAGGFYCCIRAGISQFQTGARGFVGLSTDGVISDVDPSGRLNIIGMGFDAGQTTLHLIHNDASGTAASIDLGASFPCGTSTVDMYELALWCEPNDAGIGYRIERLNTGDVSSGRLTADIPADDIKLLPQWNISNGETAAAVSLDLAHLYFEAA